VIVFLVVLVFLDSYKLLGFQSIILMILIGFITAVACYFVQLPFNRIEGLEFITLSHFIAPVIEELFKAGFIVYLIRSRKIGFMVDAAILGFAVGAGFAIVENGLLITVLPEASLFVWILRGFGTAIMHGGTTALFSVISKGLVDRHDSHAAWVFLPGFAVSVVFHSLYNQFLLDPVIETLIIVVGLPLIMGVVFQQSERALQKWLGVGFDTDSELLEMITTGNITETRIGQYLLSLKEHFPGEAVADMLCMIRIHLELSIRAKGILLMREQGFDTPPHPETKEKFEELSYLEKSIGKTGRLAIMPILRWSSRDLWQLHMLGKKK
jgi:RsiW-degrading membrane proteinase PrsW (M82 family)